MKELFNEYTKSDLLDINKNIFTDETNSEDCSSIPFKNLICKDKSGKIIFEAKEGNIVIGLDDESNVIFCIFQY